MAATAGSSTWPGRTGEYLASRWRLVPGLAFVVVTGLLAVGIEEGLRLATGVPAAPVEALVIAILIGMAIRNTVGLAAVAGPGVAFAGKQLLEFAVLLLGASVNFAQLLQAGPRVLVLIVLCVALALLVGGTAGRLLGLDSKLAILVAVGNAICGNSAIAAVAPAIKAERRDITTSIALTAVVGVVLVLGLPAVVPLLGLTVYQYGVLVGTTVYAVPQVVAASFPVGVEAGEVATFVKLLRVLMIGPVVLGFGLWFSRNEGRAGRPTRWRNPFIVPWFITGFLVLAALNSAGFLAALGGALAQPPAALPTLAKSASKALMIVSMAALGMGVELAAVKTVGPRVLAAVITSIVFLLLLSLGLIALLGL
ncbi:MAG: putative sulfate exporter family transporter [Chloroflexi bacterium]|nr:putative sulfate exporter family transporter [Chloroflexota bacterium]